MGRRVGLEAGADWYHLLSVSPAFCDGWVEKLEGSNLAGWLQAALSNVKSQDEVPLFFSWLTALAF